MSTPEVIYKTDELIAQDIEAYLEQHQHKTLLRFITCAMAKQQLLIVNSGKAGRFVKINVARNAPVTNSACGRAMSCPTNSLGKFTS